MNPMASYLMAEAMDNAFQKMKAEGNEDSVYYA